MNNHFQLIHNDAGTKARAGQLHTAHGNVSTPVFMPVGSQATVKTLTPEDLQQIGFKIILSNTYHLYLRPGTQIVKEMGGLHNFMKWPGAILTDSGGYQVFSLAPLRKITEEGVVFQSHIDGSRHFFTPELAVQYQEDLGSDIMMVLDECPTHDYTPEQLERSIQRTHRWAEKCRTVYKNNDHALYGIVQGGLNTDLRKQSAAYLTSLDFPGYALGGLSLGEPKETMYAITEYTTDLLPAAKPRYLMGVGSPEDIVECITRGIDIFDCVLPTRIARHGSLLADTGRINIRNAGFKNIDLPPVTGCHCYTCRTFSAAYLHHLFNAGELLAFRLATLHNLYYMQNLMDRIRESILDDTFAAFRNEFIGKYKTTNEETRINQKQKWLAKQSSNS